MLCTTDCHDYVCTWGFVGRLGALNSDYKQVFFFKDWCMSEYSTANLTILLPGDLFLVPAIPVHSSSFFPSPLPTEGTCAMDSDDILLVI